jgi:2-iminobutanoate/2-iminopropanoate deaminase
MSDRQILPPPSEKVNVFTKYGIPLSAAVKANGFIFCSGSVALVPETGELLTGSMADQTRQTLENLKTILEQAGSCFDKLVKVNIWISDMDQFDEMNAAYAEFMGAEPPARCVVESRLNFDLKVEIDCIALA